MLQGLPKLTRSEADFANLLAGSPDLKPRALSWMVPAAKVLSELLNATCVLEFKRFSSENQPEFTGSLLGASWPPQAGHFWVEFDTKVLQSAVYAAIGQARPENLSPALSDLERGVAMYLLARIFEATKESFQLTTNFDTPKGPSLCLSMSLKIGDQSSFIRIWVSEELVHSLTALNGPSSDDKKTQAESLTSGVTFSLSVNLASVELTHDEFSSLSEGDIIVLDDVRIPGVAKAFLNTTPPQNFEGQLTRSESDQYTFTI